MRAALLALALSASTAHAFVGDESGLILATGSARTTRSLEATTVAGWSAQRDRDTGVIARMTGRYVEVPGSLADAAIAERAARTFLAQHLGVLAPGARLADFVLVANRVDDGKRTVAFVQTWNGMRVVGGQLHVVFANDRLFVAGSDALPNVRATITRGTPSLARGRAWIAPNATVRDTGERVVLPIVRAGAVAYRVAHLVDARVGDIAWDLYVAPDGEPIARQLRTHFATSTLQLDVGTRYASGARANVPAAQLQITVDGSPTTTLADGSFSWATAVAATVVPSLTGTLVRVFDGGGLATASLTAQPGQPVVWSAAGNELHDAQLSAFVYASNAKAVARRIHPTLPWLDQPLAVHVNINDSCNAYSTGDSIHFFRAGGDCENTARVADVVHHELGHSFHQQSLIMGVGGTHPTINEGYADFFAANVTADSAIGRGFHFTDDPVRELDPVGFERVYPQDSSPVSHVAGLIIGGALWDLRQQLVAKLGPAAGVARAEKIFLGVVQRAGDVTATYTAALVADDDDGDLGNGTPNFCTIQSAFGRHGLAEATFRDTKLYPPTVSNRVVSVRVDTPPSTACPHAEVTAMSVEWRANGDPFTTFPMTLESGSWLTTLPPHPAGTVIEYRVVATLDTVETFTFPDNPADPYYQVFVGTPVELWCERFDVDPAWKQDGAVEWEVAIGENPTTGDPPAAFEGTAWLGTDLTGDGRYRADIITSIATPAVDARSYRQVHLQFRRWLAIEDAAHDVATIRVNGAQIWANATNTAQNLEHVDKEWRFVDFDITSHAALAPVSVAWTLASSPTRNLGGWNIDEVCIVGVGKQPRCGDGIVDEGEACDEVSDNCTATCESPDEDGGCCSGSGGASSLLFGLGLLALRRRRR